MKTPTAARLLDVARISTPGRPVGTVQHGLVVVSWDRVARTYDVGTECRSHAVGHRNDVLLALEVLLAKSVPGNRVVDAALAA